MGSPLLYRSLTLASLLALFACNPVSLGGDVGSGGSGAGGATTSGGGGHTGACSMDCSKLPTAPCTVAVCNTGQVIGPVDTCVVVPASDGTACDDGQFCTTGDVCKSGTCVGGSQNDCGIAPGPCGSVLCDESSKSCSVTPVDDGSACSPTDLCQVDAVCLAGQCAGGTPKDCSALDAGCQVGVCDGMNGDCVASPAPDGSACNDHDACTQGDTCMAGACAGTPVPGCHLYLDEGFETCPDGWTLKGDWQCGTPMNVGPPTAFGGNNCLATNISASYDPNQTFAACVADSPTIDLTNATHPELSFWVWDWTEGGTFDGWNLKISTDGGQTYTEVTTVSPPYMLMIAGQPAWGGDFSTEGWQNYTADLTAYKGQMVNLQFGFRSDPATEYPGVYIDSVVVAEPLQIPLYITTSSLPDAYAGTSYSATIVEVGGTSSGVWSIAGGANDTWLAIDAATGVLSGTPSPAQVGPVSVTVRVEEPTLLSNFVEETFTFDVEPDAYSTGWEGACPDGWTLTGDWRCGVPTNPDPSAPTAAFDGTQCIGVGMVQDYSNNDTYAGTTATSPQIDLTGVPTPTLTFRMWVDTEGAIYDGFNLQVSTDGGMTYSVVSTVTPAYPLTIAGEPAWGGHQAALGWQPAQVDLTPYAGQTIQLRFAFRSDASGTWAGVYIDDFLVE